MFSIFSPDASGSEIQSSSKRTHGQMLGNSDHNGKVLSLALPRLWLISLEIHFSRFNWPVRVVSSPKAFQGINRSILFFFQNSTVPNEPFSETSAIYGYYLTDNQKSQTLQHILPTLRDRKLTRATAVTAVAIEHSVRGKKWQESLANLENHSSCSWQCRVRVSDAQDAGVLPLSSHLDPLDSVDRTANPETTRTGRRVEKKEKDENLDREDIKWWAEHWPQREEFGYMKQVRTPSHHRFLLSLKLIQILRYCVSIVLKPLTTRCDGHHVLSVIGTHPALS
jgi:hypothetical protein